MECPFGIGGGNHRLRAILAVSPRYVDVEIVAVQEFFDWLEWNGKHVADENARRKAAGERSRHVQEAQLLANPQRVWAMVAHDAYARRAKELRRAK